MSRKQTNMSRKQWKCLENKQICLEKKQLSRKQTNMSRKQTNMFGKTIKCSKASRAKNEESYKNIRLLNSNEDFIENKFGVISL